MGVDGSRRSTTGWGPGAGARVSDRRSAHEDLDPQHEHHRRQIETHPPSRTGGSAPTQGSTGSVSHAQERVDALDRAAGLTGNQLSRMRPKMMMT